MFMSKQWKSALAASVILASAAGSTMAQEAETGFYVGGNAFYNEVFDADGNENRNVQTAPGLPPLVPPTFTNTRFETETSFEKDAAFGASFGYKFAAPLRLELEYRIGENDVEGVKVRSTDASLAPTFETLEVESFMANLWFDFREGERLRPYFGFGIGEATFDNGSDKDHAVIGQVGVGVNYFITPRLALDVGYRYAEAEDDPTFGSGTAFPSEMEYVAQSVLVGLRYNFFDAQYGPKDADGDGVTDDADQCPGTPRGVQVDSVGCPLDGDNDGVADYLDQCPTTPAGAAVTASGCPFGWR
jgi:OOP family OmpA-OmpF porin